MIFSQTKCHSSTPTGNHQRKCKREHRRRSERCENYIIRDALRPSCLYYGCVKTFVSDIYSNYMLLFYKIHTVTVSVVFG